MLRIYQYTIQLLIIFHTCLASIECCGQDTIIQDQRILFQYKIGINGTYDKSLVKRLIFNTQNSFVLRGKTISFEPIINYRFGYVQPINRPKTDLENDVFVLLKSHFWYEKKLFPSLLSGYENSPNIRQLKHRIFAGPGVGSYLTKTKYHFLQLMVYGLYEISDFNNIHYEVFRIMPFVRGQHHFEEKRFGIQYNIQPFISFSSDTNHRLRGNIKPYFKISPRLDFNISYDIWYETIVNGIQPKEISVILFGFNYSNF